MILLLVLVSALSVSVSTIDTASTLKTCWQNTKMLEKLELQRNSPATKHCLFYRPMRTTRELRSEIQDTLVEIRHAMRTVSNLAGTKQRGYLNRIEICLSELDLGVNEAKPTRSEDPSEVTSHKTVLSCDLLGNVTKLRILLEMVMINSAE